SYRIALAEGVTSPYGHAHQYVYSRSIPTAVDPAVTVVADDPLDHVRGLKGQASDLGLCLVGGSANAGGLLPQTDAPPGERRPVDQGVHREGVRHRGQQPGAVEAVAHGCGPVGVRHRRARWRTRAADRPGAASAFPVVTTAACDPGPARRQAACTVRASSAPA